MTNSKYRRGPIPLVCPCGLSLEIALQEDGIWVIGHLDKDCSHPIHKQGGEDEVALGKIMVALIDALEHDRFKYPPAKKDANPGPEVDLKEADRKPPPSKEKLVVQALATYYREELMEWATTHLKQSVAKYNTTEAVKTKKGINDN